MQKLNFQGLVVGVLYLVALGVAHAQAFTKAVEVGDTWSYIRASESSQIPLKTSFPRYQIYKKDRDGKIILLKANVIKNSPSPVVWQIVGPFSADGCLLDVATQDSLGVQETCAMKFSEGKTWSSDVTTSLARTQERFSVGKNEEVTVPAGTYAATKIEGERTVTEVSYPGVQEPADGYIKIFRTSYWYSPDVKGMVKVVREIITPAGKLLLRETDELESYVHKPNNK